MATKTKSKSKPARTLKEAREALRKKEIAKAKRNAKPEQPKPAPKPEEKPIEQTKLVEQPAANETAAEVTGTENSETQITNEQTTAEVAQTPEATTAETAETSETSETAEATEVTETIDEPIPNADATANADEVVKPRRSSMFANIHKATEQDNEATNGVKEILSELKDEAPPQVNEKGRVIDAEVRRAKKWARAGMFINFADVIFMFLGCWIAGDFKNGLNLAAAQKRYSLPAFQKKSIRVSIFEVLMLRDKETNPIVDLVFAILFGYVPIIGLAIAARFERKADEEKAAMKAAAERVLQQPNTNEKSPQQVFNEYLASLQNHGIQHEQSTGTHGPLFQQAAPYQQQQPNVTKPVVRKPTGNAVLDRHGNPKASTKGQHKGTCPRRKNPRAQCNCK